MRAAFVLIAAMVAPGVAGADETAAALRAPEGMKRRAHVVRAGAFGLTAETTVEGATPRDGATYDDVPVVAVKGDRVRIVDDDDGARMLLWVAADDLAWTVLRETRLAGKGEVGVWLLRGAKVTVSGGGARRSVSATFSGGNGEVTVRGMMPASALGKVFEPSAAPRAMRDRRVASALLDAPDGRPLVETPGGIEVEVVAPGAGDWLLVEHRTRHLRVRGWMRAGDATDALGYGTTGTGGGYGMTHTRRIEVPAGTCLHATPGGPIAGVQLTTAQRYSPSDEDGWWALYVGNAWGLFVVHARAAGLAADGTPRFTTCR